LSRKKSDVRRQVHYCRACTAKIPVILRSDRRTCCDACRKWVQRHPGRKRVYRGRGKVPLPLPPGQGQPKTLAEALRLLADTRAYTSKLEASAEALALALTQQENAQAELRAELIRERERAAQADDALTTAKELAQAAEQKVADLEKQLTEAKAQAEPKAEPTDPSKPESPCHEPPRTHPAPPQVQPPSVEHRDWEPGDDWRSGRDEVRRHEVRRRYDGLSSLLSSKSQRWLRDGEAWTARTNRGLARPDADAASTDAVIRDQRRQIASLTDELDGIKRRHSEERSGLLDEIDDQRRIVRRFTRQLQNQESDRAEWNRERELLKRQIHVERARWDSEVFALRQDLATAVSQGEALQGKLSSVQNDHVKERQAHDAVMSTLRSECAALRTETEHANSAAADHKRERDGLELQVSSLRREYEALGEKYTTLYRQAVQWQSAAVRVAQAASDAQKKLEEEQAATNRLKLSVREKEEQISSLVKEKEERETRLQESWRLAEDWLNVLRASGEKRAAANKQREQERAQAEAEHQRIIAELQAQIETLKAKVSTLQTELLARGQTLAEQSKQLAAIVEERKQWAAEKAELERSRDEHKGRAEHENHLARMRERDHVRALDSTQRRVSQEAKEMVGSAERTLELERERRRSVEAMNEELREALRRIELATISSDGTPAWTTAQEEQVLRRELQSLREQRDGVSNERDLLSRRLLRLMEPGQYLAHATTANYDAVTDPLIALKRRELRVENDWAAIQEARNMRRRARKLDPEQTVDEQAYASALASRWRLIDRPHSRLPTPPVWHIIGFLLDEASEKYLLAIGEERIETITQKLKQEQQQNEGVVV
jgi:chromosome segregation ATPase